MKNKLFICNKFVTVKLIKRSLIFFGIIALLCMVPFSCAQQGRPEGGPKDTIPPVVISSKPSNFSIHFKEKVVRINFDEYIKLKDADKQVLISPPLKHKPIIKPMGQALKYIEIELTDTLKENTTYTVNFGRSIEDNNEGNTLPYFKYVFSTGDYLDSLSVSGTVKDSYNRETEEGISVMLYKLDTAYTDSIIYKDPPQYIAYTQDSTNTFTIDNAMPGKYKIVAIEDKNSNYLFNQKREKMGYLTDTIELPTDQEYVLKIFKEVNDYKVKRPEQVSLQHYFFGYEGRPDNIDIELIDPKIEGYEAAYFPQEEHDSIDYWFKPALDTDSLTFVVRNQQQIDTFALRYSKEMEGDSLQLKAEPTSGLSLVGDFRLSANTPLKAIDTSLITLRNKDSILVPYQVRYEDLDNKYIFDFDKAEKEEYSFLFLPGAVEDFYGEQNDTLVYNLKTQSERNYADVEITLENIDRYPVIVQLTTEKGDTKREVIHDKEEGNIFTFRFVDPGKYYVRLIYDDNGNGIWDTGNYLKREQPEEVRYMPELLDVRKNWEIQQTFILK